MIGDTTIKFSKQDFAGILSTYSDAVNRGEYKKINYSYWRSLVAATDVTITLKRGFGVEILVHGETLKFPSCDNNLGAFLEKKLSNVMVSYSYGNDYSVYAGMGTTTTTTTINNIKKENKKDMKGFNFDFGTCSNNDVRMSMYGLAVKNSAGIWVSYNPKDGSIIDVDVMNFEGGNYMFKMPVAIKDIMIGDIIIHNCTPMFVTDVTNDGKIIAVDVRAGEEKSVIPTTNMFGFNFVTKIVSLFNAFGNAPSPDAPFGNMLPFLMMNEDSEIDPMMLMMMMGNSSMDMSNPMMMYFLMKDRDGGNSDLLPLMFMMNNK